jgi:hypothetical protein
VHRSGGVALVEPLADPLHVPRQELVDASDRMVSGTLEELAQIILGI